MAENVKVSRTRIQKRGRIKEDELRRVFDEVCDGHRVSMIVEYDRKKNVTTVILSPCVITDEFIKDSQGEDVNWRSVFEVDKDVMSNLLKEQGGEERFIEKVWMPFKKTQTKKNIVLPHIQEEADCASFEILSNETYFNGSVRFANTNFRNKTMRVTKHFFQEYFAEQLEGRKVAKTPTTKCLDELSAAIAAV